MVYAIHSCNKKDIQTVDKLILPGVVAFDHGIATYADQV